MDVERTEVLALLKSIHLFNRLSEEQLDQVIERLELFLYEENQPVYRVGQDGDAFFLIQNGRVQISVEDGDGSLVLADLSGADYFGEEALGQRQVRISDAIARQHSAIFRIRREDLQLLAEQIPPLAIPLEITASSFKYALGLSARWRTPDEVIYFVSRRHPVVLLGKLILPAVIGLVTVPTLAYLWLFQFPDLLLPLILLVTVLVILGAWVVWAMVDWGNDYSIITNRRVMFLERVALLYDSRQEVPLEAILAHEIRRDQWGRMFDYGNIAIRTYAGQLFLSQTPHPDAVVNLMLTLRDRKRTGKEQERRNEARKILRQRLGLAPPDLPVSNRSEIVEEIQPGFLQQAFSALFRLRDENNGIITYWTHWWLLIRRIWAPTLTLVVLFLTLIFSITGLLPVTVSTMLLLAFGLGFFILIWWIYDFVDWRNDRYIIGTDQLVDFYKKPLGQEQRQTAPIKNIQTIEYERKGVIGLLLNFGTVHIRIGSTDFTFDNVFNPSDVQRELFQRLVEFNQRERDREQQRSEERLADWLETYHDVVDEEEANAAEEDSSNPFLPDAGSGTIGDTQY